MIIPDKCKPEKAVCKDPTVPILCNPYLKICEDGMGTLLVSDKFSVVKIKVEVSEQDTQGPVPVDAIVSGRKAGGVIRCEPGYCITSTGSAFPREDEKYPHFPPVEDLLHEAQVDGTLSLTLNAKSLLTLAQAMGTEVVILRLPSDESKPYVGVLPHPNLPHVPGAEGLLMKYHPATSI